MAGSWEIDAKPQVLVAVLNVKDIVPLSWAIRLRELQLPPNSVISTYQGLTYDHGRCMAARNCLNAFNGVGFQYCFFLDDDVVPPADAVLRLLAHNLPIVSGAYYRRHEGTQCVMMRESPQGPQWIRDFRPGELIDADLVGAGCLLIHRKVFEALQPVCNGVFFNWAMDEVKYPDQMQRCSEDYWFCRLAKKQGFSIKVDTSVNCEHIGFGQATYHERFIPLKR